MTNITINLPDDLASQAEAKGLLSPTVLTRIIGEAIRHDESIAPASPSLCLKDLDPRLEGAVNPLAFKRGKIVGDVVDPIGIAWEAGS